MKYPNSDIKAVMEKDLDVCQLLSLSVLVFLDTKKGDNPRVLCVVFDQMRPLITKKKDANAVLMSASNISKSFLDSEFTVESVAEFAIDSRGKTSIDEKIEAVVVRVLLENGLGCKSGTSGEGKDVVERALDQRLDCLSLFMNTATCSSETKGLGLGAQF